MYVRDCLLSIYPRRQEKSAVLTPPLLLFVCSVISHKSSICYLLLNHCQLLPFWILYNGFNSQPVRFILHYILLDRFTLRLETVNIV